VAWSPLLIDPVDPSTAHPIMPPDAGGEGMNGSRYPGLPHAGDTPALMSADAPQHPTPKGEHPAAHPAGGGPRQRRRGGATELRARMQAKQAKQPRRAGR
jgi:hypothetical protein